MSLYKKFGDAQYPTAGAEITADGGHLYDAFDPARNTLLGLFTAAINYELAGSTSAVDSTSPWGVAAAGTKYESTLPVADTYFEVPDREVLKKANVAFPFLALARTDGETEAFTLYHEQDTCRWSLDYVLGEMDEPTKRRLGGSLKAVRDIIQTCLRDGKHPEYQGGAVQLGDGRGGLKTMRIVTYQMGPATTGEQGDGLILYALHMTLESTEIDGDIAGTIPPLDGVNVSIGVGDEGGILKDVVTLRTEVPVQNPDLL